MDSETTLQVKGISLETPQVDFPCCPLWNYGIMDSRSAERDTKKHAAAEGARIYDTSLSRGLPHVIR